MNNQLLKKITIFLQNGLGGAEKISIEVSNALIADGWTVSFVVCDFRKNVTKNNIQHLLPRNARIINLFKSTQFDIMKELYLNIKITSPNIVFSSSLHINQRILLLSSLFPYVKFVVRNDNYLYTISKLKQQTLRLTYKFADAIISQTKEMSEELSSIRIKQNVHTLQNPINKTDITNKIKAPSPYGITDDIIFIAVGRVGYQKGFDILIRAFRLVKNTIRKSKLYIVGNTEYEGGVVYKQLQDLIHKLNLDNSVIFTGYQSNPYPYIKHANVFVLSSRNEGLPNVLIEAQFIGTPCAATTCIPIISRIIDNGKNGFLAESENPSSLATAMIDALKLGSVKMTYIPTEMNEFISLFNSLLSSKEY